MIVVLGPEHLGTAVAGTHPGELVVSAADDVRLAGPTEDAAEVAAVLPIPARACVVPSIEHLAPAVEAVRRAGGSLLGCRILVVGPPPLGETPATWQRLLGELGVVSVADATELAVELSRDLPVAAASERGARPPADDEVLSGWRDALRTVERRRLLRRRPGPGTDRRRDEELTAAVRRTLSPGSHAVAVISPKGGVGKTAVTFLLGSALARVRGDRVVAVDTNPDFGTLAELVHERVPATISDLLRDLRGRDPGADLLPYVTVTGSGLHILAAPQDPVEMERLGSGGYRAAGEPLRRSYDLVLFDCGTGFQDDITQFALRNAGLVVLVTQAQLVSAKICLAALERLAATGFDPHRVVVAVTMVRGDDTLDVDRLVTVLGSRVGAVVTIPEDRALRRAMDLGDVRWSRVASATRTAVLRVAAAVVAGLPPEAPAPPSPRGESPAPATPPPPAPAAAAPEAPVVSGAAAH